jgi:hypothetical protein
MHDHALKIEFFANIGSKSPLLTSPDPASRPEIPCFRMKKDKRYAAVLVFFEAGLTPK